MKTTSGGGDSDKNAHARFEWWIDGVCAHIDHLALYAGANGYPKANDATKDPRHFGDLFGTAKNVEDLGGKWCANPDYGREIAEIAKEIESVIAPPHTVEWACGLLAELGQMKNPEYWTDQGDKKKELVDLVLIRWAELAEVQKQ